MNESAAEKKAIDSVRGHALMSPGDRVVVGVSGGADSVCLLHILSRWQGELGMSLHVAHLDHQLRGSEAEADARYVSRLAESLGIPVTVDRKDANAYREVAGCCVEEAARELRYAFFARVARHVGASRIAVGHTRDDQVETILMHILRGTGVDGLCGLARSCPIGEIRQSLSPVELPGGLRVIRPLLDVSRSETTEYCQEQHLAPRIDSSNLSLSFLRNRLRLHLLPVLRQYNPDIDQALLRLADLAREDSAFMREQVSALWDKLARTEASAVHLDKKQLAGLAVALQRRLLRAAVAALKGHTTDIEAGHIEAARRLLARPVGKQASLPRGLVCTAGYDELVVARVSPVSGGGAREHSLDGSCPFPALKGEFVLEVPGETLLPGWRVTASPVRDPADYTRSEDRRKTAQGGFPDRLVGEFDLNCVGGQLLIRRRRPGDRFRPLGMDATKKVQDFMVDARIPRAWRDRIPIVCSPEHIIWVAGWRIDDRGRVTDRTVDVLRVEFVRR